MIWQNQQYASQNDLSLGGNGLLQKETGLTITPEKQASDENRNAFFAWLDAQKQADEVEKARKQAEVEKRRKIAKEQEAKSAREWRPRKQ